MTLPVLHSGAAIRTDWTDCLGLNLDFEPEIKHRTFFPLFICSALQVQLVLVPVVVFPSLSCFCQLYWDLISPSVEPQSRCFLHWGVILYPHLALFPTWAPLSVRTKFGMHVLCSSVVCI